MQTKWLHLNQNWAIYTSVLVATLLMASKIPITIDESYYIAFAKNLQLSYVDHPPFVAYLNLIQAKLDLMSPLDVRLSVIMTHWIATLFLLAIVHNHCQQDKNIAIKLLITFLMAYVTPIFGLFGILIFPDSGLLLSLSIMIWSADKALFNHHLRWIHALGLGVGLGIGLLSKYHIFPLGFGLLLGVLIDLTKHSKERILPTISKLAFSVMLGLIISLPIFIWNFQNHYATFLFQLQHGFIGKAWAIRPFILFIFIGILCLMPFGWMLIKRGLLVEKKWCLLIPFCSLLGILLASSLRNKVAFYWAAPAFWILIPYTVIYGTEKASDLKLMLNLCQFSAFLWFLFVLFLLLPGGFGNLRTFCKFFTQHDPDLKSILLWQRLPSLTHENGVFTDTIHKILNQKQPKNCKEKKMIIGTIKAYWAAELEYHHVFPEAKILNLDTTLSNFYQWRDDWQTYANCHLLLISFGERNMTSLFPIANIHHQYIIHQFDDYPSLEVILVDATLKDASILQYIQTKLLSRAVYF